MSDPLKKAHDAEREEIRRHLERIGRKLRELEQRSKSLEKRIDEWYKRGLLPKRSRKKKNSN